MLEPRDTETRSRLYLQECTSYTVGRTKDALSQVLYCGMNQLLKKHKEGIKEKAQQLGALAALPEDTGSIPSTHIVILTTVCNCNSRVP